MIEKIQSVLRGIKQNLILLTIVIMGFLLRIIGTNPGYYQHGYEIMYGQAVSMILNKTIGLEGNALPYPPLVAWMMAISFLFFFIPLSFIGYFINHFSDQGLDTFTQWNTIFAKEILGTRYWQNAMYWGRYLTALFGAGSILLAYKVVLEHFSKKGMAIIAAFMVAVNYRLVLNSHMGFPDMYNVFFLLLTLYVLGKLMKRPKLRYYILASLSAGLLFLVKYQPSGFIALGIAHTIISVKKSGGKRNLFLKKLFSKEIIALVLVTFLIILVAHINYFMRADEVLKFSQATRASYDLAKFALYLFPFSYIYHTGLGETLSLLALGGIVLGLVRKKYRQSSLIILSVIIITFFLTAFYSSAGYYTYNLLIPIATLLVFSALFLEHIREWATKKFFRGISSKLLTLFYSFILIFVLKDHITNSFISTRILSSPSYYILAQDWMKENIKGPAVFGTYSNLAPQKDDVKDVQFPNLEEVFGLQEFLEEKVDYALIDFYQIHERLFWWMLLPPRIPTQFWDKPDNLLSQTYFALAARELLWTSTLQAFLPKWQVYGYSFAVVKPTLATFIDVKLLKQFNFESQEGWSPLVYLAENSDKLVWTEEGEEGKGSLSIKAGKRPGDRHWKIMPGSIRWESPEIKIESGFGYKVTGWIKNEDEVEKKLRNGFLRLDFHEKLVEPSIESRPITSFVSARIYGKSEWHKVEIQAIAPREARFLMVSFQADNPTTTFYLDSIEIQETIDKPVSDDRKPYVLPDEDFFNRSDSSFI